jgi:hypothetical protein
MAGRLGIDFSKLGKPEVILPEYEKDSDKLCAEPMLQKDSEQSLPGGDDGVRVSETH